MYVVSLVPCSSGTVRWTFLTSAAVRWTRVLTGLPQGILTLDFNLRRMWNFHHPLACMVSKTSLNGCGRRKTRKEAKEC